MENEYLARAAVNGTDTVVVMAAVMAAVNGTDTVVVMAAVNGTDTVVVMAAVNGTDTVVVMVAVNGTDTVVVMAAVNGTDTVAVIGNTDNGFHAVGEYGFPDLVGLGFVDDEKKDSLWLSLFLLFLRFVH
ncbi:hypothetical protein [Peribacillus sp. FSL M8-0224]|uniref:hypothetical protein n=1 Tax=Peribacillus sp. FSL M8-0224 TaxID=2921568 RepID=UPI0030F9AA31